MSLRNLDSEKNSFRDLISSSPVDEESTVRGRVQELSNRENLDSESLRIRRPYNHNLRVSGARTSGRHGACVPIISSHPRFEWGVSGVRHDESQGPRKVSTRGPTGTLEGELDRGRGSGFRRVSGSSLGPWSFGPPTT